MSDYIADVTDKIQSEIEQAKFEGGVPVFKNKTTRVIAKGADGMAERVSFDGVIRKNAGVVMNASDKPGVFEQPGKRR